ncbi:MAG: ATP-binding protein [Acidimicrobiaceae bacterium]|nr:ATP-binding protein [Acidimicrobiaceae bacterium]MCY3644673.1 ATP-binding protein [Acidimicrobiaceae bacterium]MDE0494561.1 ATP-binding protein [Acidimicrobiaceae bacterium]MXY09685.1 ATP-binding protein [Acidimicrobiaceae bacterium]MXZ65936.1 ATP-binding protein [Acidimicrobiaceae bacterium]
MLFLRADTNSEVRKTSYNELADLVAAIEELGEEDGWSGELTFRISLVVDELAQNVVDYAYIDTPGDVEVAVTSTDETVVIEITDEGKPFDPLTEAPAPDLTSPIESRPIGGLGVHFTKTLMDDVEYRRESGQNRLRIVARKVK